MEEACHWERALRIQNTTPLPVCTLCPVFVDQDVVSQHWFRTLQDMVPIMMVMDSPSQTVSPK